MVVDDDIVSRTVVQKHLLKKGFEVNTAANGSEALQLFDKKFFPIILTDWMMPEIDGPQLCRLIRKKKTDGYVFILLITARDSKTDIVSGLESGADDYLTKPIHPAEMVARIKTGVRILELEHSLKKATEEIRVLSITDPLTGCFNRGYLSVRFPQELNRAVRYSQSLSVILADIDHFKKVNDTHGHQVGDVVLKEFAQCIHEQLRKKIDWVVRYGGEEFLIILPETKSLGAYSMAERLRATVAEREIRVGDVSINITASFGGACVGFENKNAFGITMDKLVGLADKKLYESKDKGRDQVSISECSMAGDIATQP